VRVGAAGKESGKLMSTEIVGTEKTAEGRPALAARGGMMFSFTVDPPGAASPS
jgi:hypothetical protein